MNEKYMFNVQCNKSKNNYLAVFVLFLAAAAFLAFAGFTGDSSV